MKFLSGISFSLLPNTRTFFHFYFSRRRHYKKHTCIVLRSNPTDIQTLALYIFRFQIKDIDLNMDLENFCIDPDILCSTLHDIIEFSEETTDFEKSPRYGHNPSRAYVRDCKAMARTPADVKEYPNSYVFEVDMPGIKASDIKVHLEDNNKVLVVSGERKREKDKEKEEGVIKYVRMERKAGKFMRKFPLPENANPDAISAVYQDGVLIVTVQKKSPPEPKKPKTIEVKVA